MKSQIQSWIQISQTNNILISGHNSSAGVHAVGSTRPFLISSIMGIREEKDHHGHSAAVMAAAAAAAESTMAAMNEEYLKRMQRHAAGKQSQVSITEVD